MSVDNFKPEIWSRELLYSLKKSHVGPELVNRNYQGSITSEGDTVRIQSPDAITTGSYDGSDISFQSLTSATQSLLIDQADYFAYLVDDVDEVQSNVNLMQSYMQEASYSLGDDTDTFIFSFYTDADASNVIAAEALTSANIYGKCVEAKKNLSLNNVPSMNRWVVFSPEEIALLEQSDEFTAASNLGDSIKRTGFAGRIAGLEVFQSNNVQEAANVRHNMYGSNMAITWADQIVKTEAGRAEKKFADFVKGLHVYGGKVVRATALGDLRNDISS